MLTTNDSNLWQRAWSFKDHGKNYDAVYKREHPPGFRWLHESFGTNWRMTEMQAAIGRILLRKVPEWVQKRRQYAAIMTARLAGLPALRIPQPPSHSYHSYYKYYAFVRSEMLQPGWNRDRIAAAIAATGVPCLVGSCSEIYLEKAFAQRPEHERLPIAKQLGETSLMFLVHPTLTEQHVAATCDVVESVLSKATLPTALKNDPHSLSVPSWPN
jgi:dTDP-4-amino-4,6-dideoxygalactose transaminase